MCCKRPGFFHESAPAAWRSITSSATRSPRSQSRQPWHSLLSGEQEPTGWQWIGPAVYIAFVALMVVVEYVWPVEFRSPARYGILVPYLLLFFGAILLMGLPMFRMDRQLWLVTVATTILLLGAMGIAMQKGVG